MNHEGAKGTKAKQSKPGIAKMTYPYQWSSLPSKLEIKCPSCAGLALFQAASVVKIARKDDVLYFQDSKYFEYRFIQGGFRKSNWHAAIFHHGLRLDSPDAITDLPDGYSCSNWNVRSYSRNGGEGTARCSSCKGIQKHILDWPHDAYYQTEVRGQVLWAYNRPALIALRDYIEATERDKARRNRFKAFLMNVPTHFLTSKVRVEAVKKLSRLLDP